MFLMTQNVRWRLACRRGIGESSWDQYFGEVKMALLGGEREREKVNCVCCSCKKNLTRVAVQCSSPSELS